MIKIIIKILETSLNPLTLFKGFVIIKTINKILKKREG
jgi:hypothetical protein